MELCRHDTMSSLFEPCPWHAAPHSLNRSCLTMKSCFRLPGRFHPGPAYCRRCGRPAVWTYSPTYSGKREWRRMFCDQCVPRGCSCQLDRHDGLPYRDKRGRRIPCGEYTYSADGFILSRTGTIIWRTTIRSGRFIAPPPQHGSALRWPPAWYLSGARSWSMHESRNVAVLIQKTF